MAEVHLLPLTLDATYLSRSYEVLKKGFEAGDDLGSRKHHIEALCNSLVAAEQELQRQLDVIRAAEPITALDLTDICDGISEWSSGLSALLSRIKAPD